MAVPDDRLDVAADAIRRGDLVVYPTETVYGLGADAVDADAIGRVFEAKRRSRDDPLSMAVPDVDAALAYANPAERTLAFMEAFLPGPVTVVCPRGGAVPDALTGGRDRVGVRVPDHPAALALLERTAPVTATSANVSGRAGASRVADLDPEMAAVAVVLDGGETPGGASTVVDPGRNEVVRRGRLADEVEAWLAAH